jgi:hypothetical protein
VTQQADKPNDIGRNFLLGNRKKIAKFLMRTFTCGSTFLYATYGLAMDFRYYFLFRSDKGDIQQKVLFCYIN